MKRYLRTTLLVLWRAHYEEVLEDYSAGFAESAL